jgi:EpsI family protein
MRNLARWMPAGMLGLGCVLNGAIAARRVGPVPLRAPIATVAPALLGTVGTDDSVDAEQRRVAGMTSYVMRDFVPATGPEFSIYVGYYDEQRQGKSIHSPKNCLPGAGWEPIDQGVATVQTAAGPVVVNRYRVANGQADALVYYWYQGRNRVAHDEFRVKYELLRDAALHGRTEEALVRIVVPILHGDVASSDRTALAVAPPLLADVDRVLPRM